MNTFKRIDEMIISERGQDSIRKIQKELGIQITSPNKKVAMEAGCTANIVLITPQHIYTANIGDTRGMLIRKDGVISLS